MLEFKLEKELDTTVPKEIGFNYEELKSELTERLDHYKHLVVTEDAITEAKADRAKLNGLNKAIDDRRKEIKKEYMKPYEGFEKQVKELTTLIAEPIAAIDTQLQVFEEKRAAEKREACIEAYNEIFQEETVFTFDRIMNPSWINKTTSMTKVRAELLDKKNRIDADMIILDTVEEEYRTIAKNQYEATMDITSTMNWVTRQKEAAEARKRVEEMAAESRRRAQEREAQANAQSEPETRPEAPEPAPAEELQAEKLYTLKLEFNLTQKQAVALKQFISQNGITYKKI